MASAVKDRYDEISDDLARVGAHRGPRQRSRGWIVFAWAALAVGILVVAGVFALTRLDSQFSLPLASSGTTAAASASSSASATPTEITDPSKVPASLKLEIAVLNGSPTAGRATAVGTYLSKAGWPINGEAEASSRTEKTTVVYYTSTEYASVARGLVKVLGVGTTELSSALPGAPVTIVVGSDYKDK